MNLLFKALVLSSLLAAVVGLRALPPFEATPTALTVSPSPTYDPLAQPVLPANPSEPDLGRNLYWHHCMPCHGDRGQGLTDDFRAIWEPDHQNCWARGCHSGSGERDSFPIPTVVPGLVGEDHLAEFESVQALQEYLKATHPPQDPGLLDDTQYHAIASFLFDLNDRPLVIPTPVPAHTPVPGATIQSQACPSGLLIVLSLVLISALIALSHIRRGPD